jgi:hypothetical protein
MPHELHFGLAFSRRDDRRNDCRGQTDLSGSIFGTDLGLKKNDVEFAILAHGIKRPGTVLPAAPCEPCFLSHQNPLTPHYALWSPRESRRYARGGGSQRLLEASDRQGRAAAAGGRIRRQRKAAIELVAFPIVSPQRCAKLRCRCESRATAGHRSREGSRKTKRAAGIPRTYGGPENATHRSSAAVCTATTVLLLCTGCGND